MQNNSNPNILKQIIIETSKLNNIIRVSATDIETKTEVIFMVPANTTKKDIEQLSRRKLKYVINKN